MKKLLALVLCVMMFVSILPTSAFAEEIGSLYPWIDIPMGSAASYKNEIKDMIKNTREEIEGAYAVMAADKSIYGTAKAMDDTVVGLVDALAKNLIGEEIWVQDTDSAGYPHRFNKDDSDAVKALLRKWVDAKIAGKLADNTYKFYDGDDYFPLKYAQVFADSVAKVLTDKDFQKGYEAVATYFAVSKLMKDVNDKLEDEWKALRDDAYGTKFDTKFAERYPLLAEYYVDTFAELYDDDDPSLGLYDLYNDEIISLVAPYADFPIASFAEIVD
jgi:hypothetical protein